MLFRSRQELSYGEGGLVEAKFTLSWPGKEPRTMFLGDCLKELGHSGLLSRSNLTADALEEYLSLARQQASLTVCTVKTGEQRPAHHHIGDARVFSHYRVFAVDWGMPVMAQAARLLRGAAADVDEVPSDEDGEVLVSMRALASLRKSTSG